jgi:2-polyprenyl-3-methyl-5-hydroxy-6-metoxy-1,4-benzoquinol methylase
MELWNQVYSTKSMARYPDNMLIRFVAKHYYDAPNRKEVKFFDVGCGVGSSTWYLAREGFSVVAIDWSDQAMEQLRLRLKFENLEALMVKGDITKLDQLPLQPDLFDCVVDVSSLCYVPQNKIESLMKKLHMVLKPGGRIFSMSPTAISAKEPFNNTIDGVELNSNFRTQLEMVDLFKDFENLKISLYTYDVERDDKPLHVRLWVTTAMKGDTNAVVEQ